MKIRILLLVLLTASFLFLRLYRIEDRVNFSMDQGLFALRSFEIFQNKEITLIGPPASPIVHGHHFFQGPLVYYSILLALLVSGWNPLIASYVLVFLNLLGGAFLYLTTKKLGGEKAAIFSIIFFTFLQASINFSNFIWNPNFLLTLTPIFLWVIVNALHNKNKLWFLASGIMAGVCLQFHFQFALIILLTLFVFLIKKEKLEKFIIFIMGTGLGYAPLLIFDLRNNFYNIKTILEWLRFGGDEKFNFQIYYFLSFIPIICLIGGVLIKKLNNKIIWIGFFLIFIGSSFIIKLTHLEALGMPNGWTYKELSKTAEIIKKEGDDFNVANLLSGDTRFYSLRYLLIKDNKKPKEIDSYESAKQLFVVSRDNFEKTSSNPVWEISSFGKATLKNEWKLNERINLYELVKAN